MNKMQNATETVNLNDRLSGFVQKNRKPIFVSLGLIVLALIGTVAALSIADISRKKAIAEVEELNSRYEKLRMDIAGQEKAAEVETLLKDLTAFAGKHSGYPGARAWLIIAAIHADKKEWAEAGEAYLSAAKSGSKTYLAPIAHFNAAAAAEEQGKLPEALELYTQSVTSPQVFPAASRAQFSIGRLKESQGDKDAAIAAYRELIAKWPNDTAWTNLARSRIIALETGTE